MSRDLFAVIIALVNVLAALLTSQNFRIVLLVAVWCSWAVSLIWEPTYWGRPDRTAYFGLTYTPTAPWIVRAAGWVMLFFPAFMALLVFLGKRHVI